MLRRGMGLVTQGLASRSMLPIVTAVQRRDTMAFVCDIPAVPTVQVDDATLRITRWDCEPGAVTGWHEHGWPYFVTMLVAGTLRVHDGDTVKDVPLKEGEAYMRPAGI